MPVGWISREKGRRFSILLGCGFLMLAHVLQGSAVTLWMVLVGQSLLGVAGAFLSQATYIEAAEISPAGWRGAFTYSTYLGEAFGMWSRSMLARGLSSQESGDWGWRVTVLFVLWPATAAMMMVPFIPETPNSLIQRTRSQLTMLTRKGQLPPLMLISVICVLRELCGGDFVRFFLAQILVAADGGTQGRSFAFLQLAYALQLAGEGVDRGGVVLQ
eukprot:gene7045-7259_t